MSDTEQVYQNISLIQQPLLVKINSRVDNINMMNCSELVTEHFKLLMDDASDDDGLVSGHNERW